MFNFRFLAAIAAVGLMANTSSADVILAAWDTFNDTSQNVDPVTGLIALGPDISDFSPTSTFSFGGDVRDVRGNSRGSNDGTFGSAITGADASAGAANDSLRMDGPGVRADGQELLINVTAADALNFSTFHFDAGNNPNPTDTFGDVSVSFIDGAGVETPLPNGIRPLNVIPGDGTVNSSTGNYLDLDFDASGLSLAAGETGAFRLVFFDVDFVDGEGGAAVHLDNIAITVVDDATGGPGHGDVNLDGDVNFLDISPFIAALSGGGGFQIQADCNQDGSVDFLDISPFIAALSGQ